MEKLLNLLNEHAHTYAEHYDDTWEEITITFTWHYDQCFHYTVDDKEWIQTLVDDVVISKRFWFIKWLVDNEKIDLDKIPTRMKYRLHQYKTELWWYGRIDEYSELLMLLSIQDEPIKFLVSILK